MIDRADQLCRHDQHSPDHDGRQQQKHRIGVVHDFKQLRSHMEQPLMKRIQHVFIAEERTEQKTEDGRRNPDAADDAEQLSLFFKRKAQHRQYKPLSQIAEHETEENAVGYRHEEGRIHVAIARQGIHFHKQFERPHEPVIFQNRRADTVGPLRRLSEAKIDRQIGKRLLKFSDVFFAYKAGQNQLVFQNRHIRIKGMNRTFLLAIRINVVDTIGVFLQ